MNTQRIQILRDNLLNQLNFELGESSRLFIMHRDYLRNKMGWINELNISEKVNENEQKIKTITFELLKLMEKKD